MNNTISKIKMNKYRTQEAAAEEAASFHRSRRRSEMLSSYLSTVFLVLSAISLCHWTPGAVRAQALINFSLDKLMEYNDLVACIGLINKDFTECNTKGAEKAKSVLGKMDMGPELGKRIRCCGAWKLRDCWMKAATQKCKKSQAEQIYKLPVLLIPGIEEDCRDYLPESGKCEFPTMLAVAIVSAIGLLLAGCVGSIVFCVCRRKQRHRSKHVEDAGMHLNGHPHYHHQHRNHPDVMIPGKRGILVLNGDAHCNHPRHGNNTKTLMTVDGEDGKLMNGNCNGKNGHKHHRHHNHHQSNGKVVKVNGNLKKQQQQQQQPPPLPPPDIHVEMPTVVEPEVEGEEEQKMLP